MPAEYLRCVKEKIARGIVRNKATKSCAIAYQKKHGMSPQEAAGEKARGKQAAQQQIQDLNKIDMHVFVPFSKIDNTKQFVFGYASTDNMDSQGEIVEEEATFKAADEFADWDILKEMHQMQSAVGIVPIIEKHKGIGLYVGAEVVDEQAWIKCQKKVYKGFSIGGRVTRKEGNIIKEYQLREISLVDRPANPDTMFVVAKRDEYPSGRMEEEGGIAMKKNETNPPKPEDEKKDVAVKSSEKTEPKTDTKPSEEVKPTEKIDSKDGEKPSENKDESKPAEDAGKKTEGEAAKVDSNEVDLKKKLDSLEKENKELKKNLEKQNIVKTEFLKMIGELKPELKKNIDAQLQKSEDPQEQMKKTLEKMDVGELTSLMLKSQTEIKQTK